jgi:hypothetical protein
VLRVKRFATVFGPEDGVEDREGMIHGVAAPVMAPLMGSVRQP